MYNYWTLIFFFVFSAIFSLGFLYFVLFFLPNRGWAEEGGNQELEYEDGLELNGPKNIRRRVYDALNELMGK